MKLSDVTPQQVSLWRATQDWESVAQHWAIWRRNQSFALGERFVREQSLAGGPPWPEVGEFLEGLIAHQNHTLRMHCRRLTRLTNAFSKKLENFEAAVALSLAYYNFVKRHISERMTPAQAAGVESSAWTVAELLERCGEI